MTIYWYARPQMASATDRSDAYPNAIFRNISNSGILARVKSISVMHPSAYTIGLRDGQSLQDPGGEPVQHHEIGIPQGLNLDRSSYYPPDDPARFSQCEIYCSQIVGGITMGQLAQFPAFTQWPMVAEIVLPPNRAFAVRGHGMGQQLVVSVIWTEEPYSGSQEEA